MKDGKAVPALAAGGHLDPNKTGVHLGPYNDKGHLGICRDWWLMQMAPPPIPYWLRA